MTPAITKCPICQYHNAQINAISIGIYDISCPRCGPFQLYLGVASENGK